VQTGVVGHWQPTVITFTKKQWEFFNSKARHTAFFGGIGSGKTLTACLKGIYLAETYPGIKGVVVRETHVKLNDSTKAMFVEWLELYERGKPPNEKLIYSQNNNENWIKFNNGSVVFFRHAHDEGLFKGPEYGWFLVDQAEELAEVIAKRLCDRLRQPKFPNVGMWVGNTDQGHNWCYNWFKKGEMINSALVETTFLDNIPNLNKDYVFEQINRPEEEKKIWLYGSWDNPGGKILHLTREHFIDPFEIPDTWYRYLAIDPAGSRGTTGVLAFCLDFAGNIFFIREYYGKNKIVRDHCEHIVKLWDRQPRQIFLDPSAWRRQEIDTPYGRTEFVTLADRYRKYDVYGVPAENAISVGIDILASKARVDAGHKHPFTDEYGAPHIYFVKSQLPNLMSEIDSWMYQDPSKEPVHLVDPLRYAVASRPVAPVKEIRDLTESYSELGWEAM